MPEKQEKMTAMSGSNEAAIPENGRKASLRYTLMLGTPLLVLALAHMLSNMLRTLPAVATDVISVDIAVTPERLAVLTGAYHFTFALGQIPVGAALDRYGVRVVSLTLLSLVTAGTIAAAMAGGATGFLIAQLVLGIGCCGMLLCPLTLAARTLAPAQFGWWSGLIQSVGNSGMLLSASPMAWLIEVYGWRTAFWSSTVFAIIITCLVWLLVPNVASQNTGQRKALKLEAREIIRIGLSPQLRGVIILAFVSLAAALTVRGLWAGPWLMSVKQIGRIDVGNALLPLTVAMVIGPIVYGTLDRRLGHRRLLIAGGHIGAALALVAIAGGGAGGFMSAALNTQVLPVAFDIWAFFIFGLAVAAQPLLFAMGRATVSPENTGKALAAVNLAFFSGTALLQSLTGPLASALGLSAVLYFTAFVLLAASGAFMMLTKRRDISR